MSNAENVAQILLNNQADDARQRDMLEACNGELRDALRWLMGTYLDHTDRISDAESHIPNHYCEFDYAPDAGGCEWHKRWVDAAEMCGLLDEWAADDMEANDL